MSDGEFTDIEKAAVLLISLGESDAAEILRHLGPKEVQKIGEAMARLDNIAQSKVETVISDFLNNVSDQTGIGIHNDRYIRGMLNQALGEEKAKTLIDRILLSTNTSGLDTLRWMDPKQIAELIRHEHPQIQSVILSYLDTDLAAGVLAFFDENVRLDLVMRISSMEEVQPAALQELNDMFETQFAGTRTSQSAKLGGVKHAADIMNYVDGSIEQLLLEQMRELDEGLATQIQDLMFVFADLADIQDSAMQTLLREIQTDVLVLALKGADSDLQDKVYKNMSKRAADLLRDDLEAKGPVRVSEVEEAQKEILSTARRLADEGEIVLGGSGDEMI